MTIGEFLIDVLTLWSVGRPSSGPPEFLMRFELGDRLEQRVNGVPFQQGRVVAVSKEADVQSATVEWDDGTRTTGTREDILRSAVRIHPLARRLERPGRP
ncbi:MAG: hypothetical protein DME04_19595 [Candidatus Rokuibacteriota bacterium]|nr:MAG: hypothetical protein DME04_19595 [Candidatus Rokubacteria bacterium]